MNTSPLLGFKDRLKDIEAMVAVPAQAFSDKRRVNDITPSAELERSIGCQSRVCGGIIRRQLVRDDVTDIRAGRKKYVLNVFD